MPKSKISSRQPALFKRQVPQMPDGYYSSGPNPNLRAFIEAHATPYDPVTDKYNKKPFDQPITTTKATAIYNMHTYWSKKPHDAIREYIKHYTKPGDLVLDPFCGSGGTALAALMEGRAAVAIDLSPAATFITKNYCTPVHPDELQAAFDELKRKVAPEIHWLYETRCDRCDGRATTGYTVFSYVFQCPRCLEKTSLFDCIETTGEDGKAIRVCPICSAKGIQEEIHVRLPRFGPIPVLVNYLCEEGCKPQRGERRHNDLDAKKREFFQKYDVSKIVEIEQKFIPYWYPPHRMMNIESDSEPWGDKWRSGTSSFRTVAELFTKRNLWALALWLDAIRAYDNSPTIKSALLFGLNSSIYNCCRMLQESAWGGALQRGTYYIPSINRESPVPVTLGYKIKDLVRGYEFISDEVNTPSLVVSTQSAVDLSKIPDNTIDYLFTDPPYGGSIQYGELNFLWEAWLDFDTHWHKDEIIVNNTRHITDLDWSSMMRRALTECFRVLKPGRWLSLCYHDTSEGTWQFIQDLMAEIGYISEKSNATVYIDTGQKSYNQLTAEKVTKRDLVINFRKPRPGELSSQMALFDPADLTSFQDAARLILSEALTAHPGATADRLYDELVSRTVRRGVFERHDFDALLRSVAEPVRVEGAQEGVRWYLKATADAVDESESRREEAAATRLETFMQRGLQENRFEGGVHYSDLFEQYLPVKDKPRRLLQDWLPEFFFKTPEGTWRPPAGDDERAQKSALRASGALRRIKRFANALIEGVPPYEKDRPENAAALADWIYQCRRAGLYDLGRVLYEKGGLRFDALGEEAQLQVEEDYQICVKRRGEGDEKKSKGKKGKSGQQVLNL